MKRFLTGFGLGLAGIVLALGLTLGALAVAVPDVGEPPTPPVLTVQGPSPSVSPGHERGGKDEDDRGKGDDHPSTSPTSNPSPSIDDDHSGSPVTGNDDDRSDDDPSGSDDEHDQEHDGEPDDD